MDKKKKKKKSNICYIPWLQKCFCCYLMWNPNNWTRYEQENIVRWVKIVRKPYSYINYLWFYYQNRWMNCTDFEGGLLSILFHSIFSETIWMVDTRVSLLMATEKSILQDRICNLHKFWQIRDRVWNNKCYPIRTSGRYSKSQVKQQQTPEFCSKSNSLLGYIKRNIAS